MPSSDMRAGEPRQAAGTIVVDESPALANNSVPAEAPQNEPIRSAYVTDLTAIDSLFASASPPENPGRSAITGAYPQAFPFIRNNSGTNGSAQDTLNIGDLFVLDRLFWGDDLLSPGTTTLGDLLILNQLFGGNDGVIAGRQSGLTLSDLFVLDRLFANDDLLAPDKTTLGDIFILDQLFGNVRISSDRLNDLFVLDRLFANDNLLKSGPADLGDILMLDQLFHKTQ